MASDSVLQLDHVTKSFGRTTAVDDLSLTLSGGEIYGFLGPNGAGKTTTIRMIMDFIRPTNGSIRRFDGERQMPTAEAMQHVGFLSADSTLYPGWTAAQHIAYVERVRGGPSDALILAKRFELALDVPYRKLSSGNKQKLALILAMMHHPKLLVLDEPARGLDPLLQAEIHGLLQAFRHAGGSVFMSSHSLSEVQKLCDRVGIIKDGRLVASETMDSLLKLHVHQITVQFASKVTMKPLLLKHVELRRQTDRELVVNVRGDLNAFLRAVMKHEVRDIEISHLSLEELFMGYYQ